VRSPRRPPPELILRLPLEEAGKIILAAETREDELRLREWLRRSRAMAALPGILERLLDDLDAVDGRAA
jgi:hypothetical protein